MFKLLTILSSRILSVSVLLVKGFKSIINIWWWNSQDLSVSLWFFRQKDCLVPMEATNLIPIYLGPDQKQLGKWTVLSVFPHLLMSKCTLKDAISVLSSIASVLPVSLYPHSVIYSFFYFTPHNQTLFIPLTGLPLSFISPNSELRNGSKQWQRVRRRRKFFRKYSKWPQTA